LGAEFLSVRTELVEGALVRQHAGGCPAATHFLLLRQKKVSKEKATPLSASLRCATGNLRCSVQPGPGSNSPSAQTVARPDPSGPALLGASRRGWEQGGVLVARCATLHGGSENFSARGNARQSRASRAVSRAVMRRRVAQGWADKGSRLFEPKASSSETPPRPSNAACPKRSAGSTHSARLFFAYFLLAKQKKVSCRRATPGTCQARASKC